MGRFRCVVVLVLLLATSCASASSDDVSPTTRPAAASSTTSSETPTTPTTTTTTTTTTAPVSEDHDRMRAARATWRSLEDDLYDFQYLFNCECGRDNYHVRVRPGKSPEVRNGPADPEMAPYLTVDQLFEDLEQFYRQGDEPDRIRFHEATGVPMNFVFDGANPIDDKRVVFNLSGIIMDPFERVALSEELDALAVARARWAAAEMPDYDFTFRTVCFCDDRPRQVSVREGVVTQVLDHENQPLGPTGLDGVVPIASLFDLIADVLVNAFSVDVQYEPETGYPRFIEVDYVENAVDDEVNYQVSDLRPVSS